MDCRKNSRVLWKLFYLRSEGNAQCLLLCFTSSQSLDLPENTEEERRMKAGSSIKITNEVDFLRLHRPVGFILSDPIYKASGCKIDAFLLLEKWCNMVINGTAFWVITTLLFMVITSLQFVVKKFLYSCSLLESKPFLCATNLKKVVWYSL